MTPDDAFVLLGVQQGSSPVEIRQAWRMKSTVHHPDAGGTNEAMIRLNMALAMALEWNPNFADVPDTTKLDSPKVHLNFSAPRMSRDASSFTVNVLPVECWMALEVVAALCGPTVHDDPPYLLEFLLHDSSLPSSHHGWCRCECVPEAGATTVHLSVGSTQGVEAPALEDVRDYLVEQLNLIDWPT